MDSLFMASIPVPFSRGSLRALSDRCFPNKSPNDMAFPHPKSRKDKYGNEDKPSSGGVLWNFFERTINVPDYRNRKDDVNPAKRRTLDGFVHDPSIHDFCAG